MSAWMARPIRDTFFPVMLKKSANLVAMVVVMVAMITGSPVFAEQKDVTMISLRPTDAGGGIDGLQHLLPQLYTSTGGNFVIHWTTGADGGDASDAPDLTDSDSDGTPDFVEDFAVYFEESYAFEVTGRGFDAPPSDAAESNDANNRNPDGRYDIFIYNMSNYGYANIEQYPNTPSYSYIGADNDYAGFPQNQDPNGDVKGAMKITAAHTFFHAIQFAYDVLEEGWWMETTSTYMEDEVYPATNDVYNYLSYWFEYSDEYGLETTDLTHEYANFIFAKHLSEDFGDDVIRAIWNEMKITDGLTAIDNVLVSNGTSLVEEFNSFTIANFFLEEMYDDGAEYRTAIAGDTTFGGVYLEYEYNEVTNGTPFTIDVGNVNYNAWMNTWATDYITLDMSGVTQGYRITFDGFNNSVNYDVSLVTKAGGVITTEDITLDANKDGTVNLLYDAAYTDVVLVIRNSGSINTTDPTWKVSINSLFVPPEDTVAYTYTNSSDVPIPDNDGWVSSTIAVPMVDNGTIKDMLVYVGIDHTWIGDLYVDLTSPGGTTVRLHARTGDFISNIYTWYDNETVLDGPGVLDDFNDEGSGGTWTLSASDSEAGDTGFIDTWSIELYVNITIEDDTTPPTSNSPVDASYEANSTGNTIGWILQDAIGPGYYRVLRNGSVVVDWTAWTNNTDLAVPVDTNIGLGVFNYTIYFNDSVGNVGTPDTVWITVEDTIPPDTAIASSPPDPSGSSSATFEFTSTEAGSTFECELDGGGYSSCTSPKSYTGLSDGTHTFNVRAIDPSSNTDPSPASYSWTIDTTPPDTTITSSPPDPSSSSSATFEFTSTEAGSTFECELDGGGYSSCTSPKSYTGLSDGTHTFNVRATDQSSNTDPSPASYSWTIDTTPPDTTITSAPPDPSSSSSATFEFTSTEAGSTFECELDGGGYSSCTSPKSYTGLSDGTHTFNVRATDQAGNTDPSPAGYSWTIDTTPPPSNLTTFNISLLQGWNLISLPLTPENTSLDAVLASIEGNYSVVYRWADCIWKKSTAARNPLAEMTVEYGYWIDMTAPDTLELTGTQPALTTINVTNACWNLVGYPSLTSENLTTLLSPINYTVVYAYINGVWKKSTAARNPLTEMSPGYGYWVDANEVGSYEVGNISQTTTFNISLLDGWNLISLPLTPENTSLDAVLASIEGNYTVVYRWADCLWKKSTAARNPLAEMTVEYGYWIDMTAPDTLELSGTEPALTTINVTNACWNLVGYPSLTPENLTTLLSPINYTVVYAYINGVWKKSTAARNPLTEMSPGYGYWIDANEDGSYEVGN